MIIVGYSQQELNEETDNKNDGFIGSLTNGELFYMKNKNPKPKLTTYNKHFIYFGNAELRIMEGKNIVESNLGSAMRYLNNKGHTTEILFGEQKKEAEIKFY